MREKALFQILLILGSIFSITSLAEPVQAQQKVCCQKTVSGDYCQYTTGDNCASDSLQAPTNCEQTSFCKLGCGFNNDDGRCFKNTPRAACDRANGCYWSESSTCDIPQCQKGCCVLGNECSFTTQLSCRNEASNFPGVEYNFDTGITSESACINTCRSAEKGACVSQDGSCKFSTRESCIETSETIQQNATIVNPNVGFHSNVLCSNPQLGTTCAAQQYTGCTSDKDEVYWFDSCGNPENIYSNNKAQSYNRGFVQPETEACSISGPNDKNCGNCDYPTGTLCGTYDGRENKPTFGDYTCLDLSCDNIEASQTSPGSLTDKKLGESWCAYDSLVGFGLDPVGSRHFRQLCINGKVLTESCTDFREEMCIQGVQGNPPLSNPESIRLIPSGSQYVEAACRNNRWSSCDSLNNFDRKSDEAATKAKKNCENIQARDCQWIGEGTAGKCIPFVPPGLKFWPGEGENAVPSADASATCEKGSSTCKVKYERPGIGLFEGRDWKCVQNCQCLTQDYLRSANDICKSYGDCGAYVNYIGEGTTDGLSENIKGAEITQSDLDGYTNLIFANDKNRGKYQDKFGAFFSRAGPALGVIGVTYLLTSNALDIGNVVGIAEKSTKFLTFSAKEGAELSSTQWAITAINTVALIYTIYTIFDIILADTKTETISATCNPWVAPLGGEKCEECGKDGKPCSEYRCRSLGQLCQLVNAGSKEEACINMHPNDVNSPTIRANQDVLLPGFTITEVANAGFKLNQKIEPFTPVTVGILTNEPAVCKYSLENNKKFEEKDATFGNPLYVYNHTLALTLPSELADNQTVLRLTNNGEYTLYVRCQDASRNPNDRDYYVKFAIKPGPDLTPPKIEVTSIANNAFIAANTTETELKLYVNEPSECKWSTSDLEYDLMTEQFTCSTSSLGFSSVYAGLYECGTTLNNLKANQKNTFYFRCKDKPNKPDAERNVNVESYAFSLSGTIPLTITSINPSGQLYDSSPILKVTTAKGAQNGKATCGYSTDNNVNSAIEFATTGNVQHEQAFTSLESGSYTYYVHCIDAGGNLATNSTTFTISIDNFGPILTRIFTRGTVLHLEFNEESSCEYSNTGTFNFGEGTAMTGDGTKAHEATLDSDFYHVICEDLRHNKASFKIYP